jgi:DNA-binding protein H-NS
MNFRAPTTRAWLEKPLVVSTYDHENGMRKLDPATTQLEELWQLYERLTKILADKIIVEKRELLGRPAKLDRIEIVGDSGSNLPPSLSLTNRVPQRKYPKVLPKYCNPLDPSQKWSGRGKQPKWMIAALEAGQRLDDLKIKPAKKGDRKQRPRGGRA